MKKSFNLFLLLLAMLLRCGSGLPVVRDGFEPLPSEWWHYDFSGWQRFEILDIGLEELPAEDH
jgi:hypothetical protein